MSSSAARLLPQPIESGQLALFGQAAAGGGSGLQPPDPEAVDLANAAIVSAALGLGIYIDSFV